MPRREAISGDTLAQMGGPGPDFPVRVDLVMRNSKVVVVGAGVVGCAIAYQLQRGGHQVVICERDRVAQHASGRAAGMLAPYSEAGVEGPFLELARHGFSLFPELVERLQADTQLGLDFAPQQALLLALDEAEVQVRRRQFDRTIEAGAEGQWLQPDDCLKLEPELTSEVRGAALHIQAHIDPTRFVRALAAAAIAAGGQLREGSAVLGLQTSGGRVTAVDLADDSIGCDWVVIASGPWSGQLAAQLGLRLPQRPHRGQLIRLQTGDVRLRRVITRGGRYLVPKPDGSLLVGSTDEDAGFRDWPTASGVRALVDSACTLVPGLDQARLVEAWAGLRPGTSDLLPLVGPVPGWSNLILATGHFRNGLLLAPLTARIVADHLNGSVDRLAAICSPDRLLRPGQWAQRNGDKVN